MHKRWPLEPKVEDSSPCWRTEFHCFKLIKVFSNGGLFHFIMIPHPNDL